MNQATIELQLSNMNRVVAALFLLSAVSASCDQAWPNGTDTYMNWWQCDSGPVRFYNVTPFDGAGKEYEYPIHLDKPMTMKCDVDNPTENSYGEPDLKNTVHIWQWGGFFGCAWSALPTLGLLKDLDACTNGIPCPLLPGRRYLDVIVDFTKFQSIIDLLKDNAPYQLQFSLDDTKYNEHICLMFQARAYLK